MHPLFTHTLADERRAEFMARAEAHRHAGLARRSIATHRTRPSLDAIRAGAALLAVRPIERIDGLTLLAVHRDEIVAVASYDSDRDTREAQVALAVEHKWQRQGVARQLLRRIARLARLRDHDVLTARILAENDAALALVHRVAPSASVRWVDDAYRVSMRLTPFDPR